MILNGLFFVRIEEWKMTITEQIANNFGRTTPSIKVKSENSNFSNIEYEEIQSLLKAIDANYEKTLKGIENV